MKKQPKNNKYIFIRNSLNKIYFLSGVIALIAISWLLDINIFGILALVCFTLYFAILMRAVKENKKQTFLVLGFLLAAFIFTAKQIITHNINPGYMPVTCIVILVTILYNNLELTFIMGSIAAIFAGIISGGSLYMYLIFLISSLAGGILTWKLRKRARILTAGLCAGIIQMALFMLAYRCGYQEALPSLFSGIICGIFATGLLPLLENIFGIATNISLLELSDLEHPLLKRLILEAPGTYHHSLIVGNLSEAAAERIGANALLARIGSYYHDIGKLANSEYFMENQKNGGKHSNITPSISKMMIMSHIKEGVMLAKKYRLKPSIIDFITTHHGTSLVYYFYRKALEDIQEPSQIQEEGFRYPGPKPNSKETAIVLLADSVEAASRAINDPQAPRIEDVVHKIINNKFIDGQLDDCDLTLRDLEKIASVFIHMLSGIYHDRIKYPEASREESNHKKNHIKTPAHLPKEDKE